MTYPPPPPMRRTAPEYCLVGDWFIPEAYAAKFEHDSMIYTLDDKPQPPLVIDPEKKQRLFRKFKTGDGLAWRRVE